MKHPTDAQIEAIARVVHDALSAWAVANGEPPYPAWDVAEDWMVNSTKEAVAFRIRHPHSRAGGQHRRWMAERKSQGWVYGAVKDPAAKTHPMLVPFSELPEYEKRKDALLHGVVDSLVKHMR